MGLLRIQVWLSSSTITYRKLSLRAIAGKRAELQLLELEPLSVFRSFCQPSARCAVLFAIRLGLPEPLPSQRGLRPAGRGRGHMAGALTSEILCPPRRALPQATARLLLPNLSTDEPKLKATWLTTVGEELGISLSLPSLPPSLAFSPSLSMRQRAGVHACFVVSFWRNRHCADKVARAQRYAPETAATTGQQQYEAKAYAEVCYPLGAAS